MALSRRKQFKKFRRPRKAWSSVLFWGVGALWIAAILLAVGLIPSLSHLNQSNSTSAGTKEHLSFCRRRPLTDKGRVALCRHHSSCCSQVQPAIERVVKVGLYPWDTCWQSVCETLKNRDCSGHTELGKARNSPVCVFMVSISAASSSSTSCSYTFFKSNVVKTAPPLSVANSSVTVSSG